MAKNWSIRTEWERKVVGESRKLPLPFAILHEGNYSRDQILTIWNQQEARQEQVKLFADESKN
jgi:hypothetical protein